MTCGLAGARVFDEACLSSASMNFSSSSARVTRAKQLGERARTNGKVDWVGYVEELCVLVLKAERQGVPAVILNTVAMDTASETAINIDGIEIYPAQQAIDFGDGGSGKSLLALYRAGRLHSEGQTVGYFDWELTEQVHARRGRALFGSEMPPISTCAAIVRSCRKSIVCGGSSRTKASPTGSSIRSASLATGHQKPQKARWATSAPFGN